MSSNSRRAIRETLIQIGIQDTLTLDKRTLQTIIGGLQCRRLNHVFSTWSACGVKQGRDGSSAYRPDILDMYKVKLA